MKLIIIDHFYCGSQLFLCDSTHVTHEKNIYNYAKFTKIVINNSFCFIIYKNIVWYFYIYFNLINLYFILIQRYNIKLGVQF